MASFRKLKSGKWNVQVRHGSVSKSSTFDSKRQAQLWAYEVERLTKTALVAGVSSAPRDATLSDLIDKYTKDIDDIGRTKRATLKMWQRKFGEVRLSNLNAQTMRQFIDGRIADKVTGSTIAQDLSFLSSVLKWARFSLHLDIEPRLALDARSSLTHRKINTRGKSRTRLPTEAELERLYSFWTNNELMQLDMVMMCKFLIASAMRVGEACRIKIEDLDREQRAILITERKDPEDKANNDQLVPLLKPAFDIIVNHIGDRKRGKVFDGYNERSVSTAFTRACKRVDPPIVDLHLHDLRHLGVTNLFRMGLDIPHAATISGHKSWSNLKRYSQISPADVHKKLEEFNK
jgi:integrase